MPLILESSLTRTWLSRCDRSPTQTAFTFRSGSSRESHTWNELQESAFSLASVLEEKGVRPGERIALVAGTSYAFVQMQWAILATGAILVPLSPLQSDDELLAIFADCDPSLIVLETPALQQRLSQRSTGSPLPPTLLLSDLPQLEARGRGLLATAGPGHFRARLWDLGSAEPFMIIYTSGTTGEPKGAMLSQEQFRSGLEDSAELFRTSLEPDAESTLMVLPLSHVFGQFELAVGMVFGWTTHFSERADQFAEDLKETQPTLLFGVPKLFERILRAIHEQIEARSAPERLLVEKLLEASRRVARQRQAHERPSLADTAESVLARQTVIRQIQKQLGGRLKFAISGGAPLSPTLASELDLLGLRVLEGYGLTETCGPVTINDPQAPAFGTVGRPLSDVEVRILSDGEITLRSKKVFLGYWKRPEATADTLREGWFHTGDLGYLDTQGLLHVTDRKKDLLILSNGRNVAPQKIENRARMSRILEEVIVVGDRRPHLSALITLKQEEVIKYCSERQILFSRYAELVLNPKIQALVQTEIEAINAGLAPYERIRRFVILPESLSVQAGEVTHTQKLRRRQIEERYPDAIEALYSGSQPEAPLDPVSPLG